ncbi:hypothetical protein [Actinomadura hibisca]|uniref:hypothetical protein n=1 Tax=Actinomadura hibisca TaxID=68565 RepID=UPI00082AAAD0|nr:hypothetical protein [Actinomadura hibisca]
MGDRANYAVLRDGALGLYEAHWGASRLTVELLPGPDAATALFTGRAPADRWLDDVAGQGGALVDHDRRRLLYHAVDAGGYAGRAAVREVLRRTWPGWRIDWAWDGQGDLADAAGQDRAAIRSDAPPLELWPSYDQEHWINCLVTVTDGGKTRAYAIDTDFADVLGRGVGLIDELADWPTVEHCASLPESGVHFDVAERAAGFWTVQPLCGRHEQMAARRPDWTWSMWNDRYTEQLARTDHAVTCPEPDMARAYATLRERAARLTRAEHRVLEAIDELAANAS